MEQSKGYRRFRNRLEYFLTDNEVAEILVLNKESLAGESSILKKVDSSKHPLLANRSNTTGSRTIVINHLRKTIYVAFIKDMYEEVMEYIHYILEEGAMNGADTERLIGEHHIRMNANDILSKKDKKEIVAVIMQQLFQELEAKRNIFELIKSIKNKLGLAIDENIIKQATRFLEIRHILVHSDGRPNQEFLIKYPDTQLDNKRRIALNSTFAKDAYETLNNLVLAFDNEMIAKNYLTPTK